MIPMIHKPEHPKHRRVTHWPADWPDAPPAVLCTTTTACPRHYPNLYAANYAKHRADDVPTKHSDTIVRTDLGRADLRLGILGLATWLGTFVLIMGSGR